MATAQRNGMRPRPVSADGQRPTRSSPTPATPVDDPSGPRMVTTEAASSRTAAAIWTAGRRSGGAAP